MDSMTNENVEWGAEIPVEGKRPEWLGDDVVVQVGWTHGAVGKYTTRSICGWEYSIKYIRLPANHPHYATPTRTALEQRMEDLVRAIAVVRKGHDTHPGKWFGIETELGDEARDILAELEPVSLDRVEAKRLAGIWAISEDTAYEILSRGRALERGE